MPTSEARINEPFSSARKLRAAKRAWNALSLLPVSGLSRGIKTGELLLIERAGVEIR